MLLAAKRAMEELNPNIKVSAYVQEMMAESLDLGKSDLIVSGESPDAIRDGDTLAHDRYANEQYDCVLSKRWLSLLIRDNGVREYVLAA